MSKPETKAQRNAHLAASDQTLTDASRCGPVSGDHHAQVTAAGARIAEEITDKGGR